MAFAIKFVHSVAFLLVSAAIVYVWYAIVSGTTGLALALAVGTILAESGIYLLNGRRCPLTNLAQRYGDVRGDDYIADIFLPERLVPWIPPLCGLLAVSGLLVLALRYLIG